MQQMPLIGSNGERRSMKLTSNTLDKSLMIAVMVIQVLIHISFRSVNFPYFESSMLFHILDLPLLYVCHLNA